MTQKLLSLLCSQKQVYPGCGMLGSCVSTSAVAYKGREDRCISCIPYGVLTVSHCQPLSHGAAATAAAAKAASQAGLVGEVKNSIRLIDRVQSLFVQKVASLSRYSIRWLNTRYYLLF